MLCIHIACEDKLVSVMSVLLQSLQRFINSYRQHFSVSNWYPNLVASSGKKEDGFLNCYSSTVLVPNFTASLIITTVLNANPDTRFQVPENKTTCQAKCC
jgi:hypothetical protein